MAVTVRHLNADSSFLLTFSSDPSQPNTDDSLYPRSIYTVLIDPWLQGDSVVNHPWFAITKLTVPPSINHLSKIEEPDLVVISQNKPDHCHAETLQQLRPEGKSIIAAEPSAAKTIKSWDHFDPARVFGLPKYNPHKKFSVLRFHIPPLAPGGDPGEVTVAFLPAKNYITGLHNGIGLTYQAPTATRSIAKVWTIDLPQKDQMEIPFSPSSLPPYSPGLAKSSGCISDTSDSSTPVYPHNGLSSPPLSPDMLFENPTTDNDLPTTRPSTPPESPLLSAEVLQSLSSARTLSHTPNSSLPLKSALTITPPESGLPKFNINPASPRPLSVLYTPHGLPLSDLMPYVQSHLIPRSALPLTLLLHSFSRVTNPWYLGGNILAGCGNGVAIARALMAKVWLSAHDESKDDQGFSVKKLRVEKKEAEEVRRMLYEDEYRPSAGTQDAERWRRKGWTCDVRDLGVGNSMVIRSVERDLVAGAEKRWMPACSIAKGFSQASHAAVA